MNLYLTAKQKNKNYSGSNTMWEDIDHILTRVWNKTPFNYNNDTCKKNTMPVGVRLGILPVCIISPK